MEDRNGVVAVIISERGVDVRTRFVATRSISPSTGKSLFGFHSGPDNEWQGESRG